MTHGFVVSAVLVLAVACGADPADPAVTPHPDAGPNDGGVLGSSSSSSSSSGAPATSDGGSNGSGALAAEFILGVNADGMEIGDQVPGKADTHYALIHDASLDKYHASGLDLVRLPIKWSRVQPELGGPLNDVYVEQILGIAASCAVRSMSLVLDVHGFGGRDGHRLGDGTLTSAHFADLWTKLATAVRAKPGIAGLDLMNEPNGMPTPEAWPQAAQAAIDAIRAVDPTVVIYLEGEFYSSAARWVETNETFPLHDPSNRLVYSAHAYGDRDASGTHFTWSEEAAQGVTTDTLVARVTPFVSWCDAHAVPCHIGEMGVGRDDPKWNEQLDKALAVLKEHRVRVTYWAAGPWWGDYPMEVESEDAPQLTVLRKYALPQ